MASFPSQSVVIHSPRIRHFRESPLINGSFLTRFLHSRLHETNESQFAAVSLSGIAIPTRSRRGVFCSCKNIEISTQAPCCRASGAGRREIMLGMALTTFSFQAMVSNVSAEPVSVGELRTYTDELNKFKMLIPQDWQVGSGDPNGFKSVTAFYPPEKQASTSNVSVVITGLGADFTRMESFGKVEEFADTLVSGLDRSWQRPPGVAAKLIDCRAVKGLYYIEYTLQNPGEIRKHLYSAIGMASNGWYNRLYTVTGQYPDEESESYGSKVEKVVNSFTFI